MIASGRSIRSEIIRLSTGARAANRYHRPMKRRVYLVLLALTIVLGAYLRLVDLAGPSLVSLFVDRH